MPAMAKLGKFPALCTICVFFLGLTSAYGKLECEELAVEDCAFAVSSKGARCVLEKSTLPNGETTAECQTSIIMAENHLEWIETDECIKSCGLERVSYGLSTDALLERSFTEKLCSSECQNNCPNIVDLYIKLAAGEGVYLPQLCASQVSKSRRLIADPLLVVQSHISTGPMPASSQWPWAPGPSNAEPPATAPPQPAASAPGVWKPEPTASAPTPQMNPTGMMAPAPAPVPEMEIQWMVPAPAPEMEIQWMVPPPSPAPSPSSGDAADDDLSDNYF